MTVAYVCMGWDLLLIMRCRARGVINSKIKSSRQDGSRADPDSCTPRDVSVAVTTVPFAPAGCDPLVFDALFVPRVHISNYNKYTRRVFTRVEELPMSRNAGVEDAEFIYLKIKQRSVCDARFSLFTD